jgi:hypothetical protein
VRLIWSLCRWLALALGAYFLAGWIGSSLPRNDGWREPERGIEILVETNGVHTAIVMPLVTAQKDWRNEFPASDVAAPNEPYTHVSVSWGEREVFLHTPTWADLSPLTVLRIVIVGGEGVLHVAHYIRPAPDATIRPLRLSETDYVRLVRRIELEIPPRAGRRTYRGYDQDDVFYDGPRPLHGDPHLQPVDRRHARRRGRPHRRVDAVRRWSDEMGSPVQGFLTNGYFSCAQ